MPKAKDKQSESSAKWRPPRMEWQQLRGRVSNDDSNYRAEYHVTTQEPVEGAHPWTTKGAGKWDGHIRGFSLHLIRLALIRQMSNKSVCILARKSMTVCFYTHSIAKRAKGWALVDSGATENFMNLGYAKWLRLPIKKLAFKRNLYNIDGMENKSRKLKYYTDLEVQTGVRCIKMRFFLMDLGEHKAILGYSWFVAMQPKIDWKNGWIDKSQLPIILRTENSVKATYLPQQVNVLWPMHKDQNFLGKVTIGQAMKEELKGVPVEYEWHSKVFSEEELQWLLGHMIWDHAIELLTSAPTTLQGRLLPLAQEEIAEVQKFVKEHLEWGTIQPLWSPYAANFFFVKKKDGKLHPVQDYCPVNKWTKKNCNVSPLILLVIDQLVGCTLFTKFNIWWGYNNIWIKLGDEWKAAFLTPEGLFKPMVMFFGLTNSLATFQMMMNTIFWHKVQEGWFSIFMDNGIIYTKWWPGETEEQHRQWHRELVHWIFNILVANNLYVKLEKCMFEQEEIEYLGVIMGKGKTCMDPKKLLAVASYLMPTTVTDIHAFLGLIGYYWYFIKGCSQIVWPLLDLTKKVEAWHWDMAQEQVFLALKMCMCTALVLTQLDFSRKFYVQMGASEYGMGAILSQEGGSDTLTTALKQRKELVLHSIAYYLATFTLTQRNYDVYDWELLAIMMVLDH
jgi:hypothetical protein